MKRQRVCREISFHLLMLFTALCLLRSTWGQARDADSLGTSATSMPRKVSVIFQDSQGAYWFAGGLIGVYQWDGNRLTHFRARDGLSSDKVTGIQEDQQGNIYFDTDQGVNKFDGEQITTLQVIEHESADQGWQLNAQDLWFRMGANRDGPCRYDGQVLHKLSFPENERAARFRKEFPNASWSPFGIYTQYRDREGSMWFGTAALGVCRYDGKSIRWLYERQLTQTPEGGDFGIRSIIQDLDGLFWICNSRYRYQVSARSPAATEMQLGYDRLAGIGSLGRKGKVNYPYFLSVVEDNAGHLWMATYDEGVFESDGEQLIHHPIQSPSNLGVNKKMRNESVLLFSIYKDRQGTLWLGSQNAGAFKFDGSKFLPFRISQSPSGSD